LPQWRQPITNLYSNLNSEKALIWRIVHRDNLPWILDHGLHCANCTPSSPGFVNIGNRDLIGRRRNRDVPIAPGGTLADYIPFYFTPFSVMMKNIQSGRGVPKRSNDELVILVSSLPHIKELGFSFVFTNAHALPAWTHYYNDLADLNQIDWSLLQSRDFARDADDPKKVERYQAEALIHQHLPIGGILGIICYTDGLKQTLDAAIQVRKLTLPVYVRTEWYFK
jgi:ssDNA thymidine ADP-ribosyltransferase, DarT